MHGKNRKEVALEKDLNLLYEMYKCRALSTAQVAQVRGLAKWYVYEKLEQLRDKGLIYSEQISGNYIPDQKRQGKYHRISGKGIKLLKEYGYQADYTADELRVSKYRLPYLLTANDLFLSLREDGWEYRDSREIKNFHSLHRNDVLQGTLTNPNGNKEYALYIFFKKINHDTLVRIKREIQRIPFENILITTRGESSFYSVIDAFTTNEDKLIKGGSVKVLPFAFAKSYLAISNDNREKHEHFLKELGLELKADRSNKNIFESSVKFDYIVRHKGIEKYFVDLLDNDLMKIEEVLRYRKEDYKREGKKVLALTSTAKGHIDLHKKMLGGMRHIEYYTIDPKKVIAFADHLSNKKHF